ncbi:MAG: hypothetical protein FWB71_07160, partial [Defluviitaleaceae bacterium]|nr:hypothetical protein [Defluviitaleaceae bacterium]
LAGNAPPPETTEQLPWLPTEPPMPPSEPGFWMYVPPGSVTPRGMRLVMVNDCDSRDYTHGVDFRIDRYIGGAWEPAPFVNEAVWILPLLTVQRGFINEEDIGWRWIHGDLPPGRYRIAREFNFSDEHFAEFEITEGWEAFYYIWQIEQAAIAAAAHARFAGLDLQILEYSYRGLTFSITNNNPIYTYIINGVFVGWSDIHPGGGSSGGVEYNIYPDWWDESDSWPFGSEKSLAPGEGFALTMDWYDSRGAMTARQGRAPDRENIFRLVFDVALDVDDEYIAANFRRRIPGLPSTHHRIYAPFDISR